ncbi:MAG TPA: sulfatase-like hydrolase/transferase [Phycisphaerae bacterium]|nr:sulfatase-like hydrolase/transferase [Phycisphaerae bacterium]
MNAEHTPGGRSSRINLPSRFRLLLVGVAIAGLLGIGWGLHRFDRLRGLRAAPKPNLLLITLDTTRADYLGCYSAKAVMTPNLDRLAGEGARFAQCSSCSPLTLPSHASLMTAVYPYVHGARQNGTDRVFAATPTLAEALLAAGYHTQAAVASFVLDRRFGLARGFEVYHGVASNNADYPLQAERRADAVCDDAVDLLRSRATEPFFLWVHFYDPHFPYRSESHPDEASPEAYADEIAFMDQQIGRLLDELRRRKLDSNTLVVAVGDHGEGLGEHDEPVHGCYLYETTLHVPLIFRYPGRIGTGQVVSTAVRTIDIAPTILEVLGCPAMPAIEGVSLCSLLQGSNPPRSLPAYAETFEANSQFGFSPLRSMTLDGWKFVLSPKPELYDLRTDPGENRDLAVSFTQETERLRQELRRVVANAPPIESETASILTSDDTSRLEALGYVGVSRHPAADGLAEVDRLEPVGANPRDHADLLRLHFQAREALKQGRYSSAEEIFHRLVEAVPTAPQLHASLARALRGQRRIEEAITAVRTAVELSPDDISIRALYGSLLSDAQQWHEAAEQYQMVLARTPQDALILHNLGIALASLGRLEEADQRLQLAVKIEPGNARLFHTLGILRSRQGRSGEAVAYLRKALAIDPGLTQAAQDLQLIEQSLRH